VVALRASCAADPDQLVCSGLDDALTMDVVDGFRDPRIAVAVALAPAGRIAFGDGGLARVAAPVQVQGGSADTLATPELEVTPIFEGLAGARSLVMIDRAAISFTDICALYVESGGASGP
jgi:predicted dienelactone hydrolase